MIEVPLTLSGTQESSCLATNRSRKRAWWQYFTWRNYDLPLLLSHYSWSWRWFGPHVLLSANLRWCTEERRFWSNQKLPRQLAAVAGARFVGEQHPTGSVLFEFLCISIFFFFWLVKLHSEDLTGTTEYFALKDRALPIFFLFTFWST